ncbi:MAG TPA: hypothetical protein DD670_08995 [Planctomycetaceae bacterium]|nr:hypothetical protein [Planctomycetaceae bacterium]
MTRILHITSGHRPTDIRILQKECRALAEAGHDVALAAPDDGHHADTGPVRLIRVPPPRERLERFLGTPRRLLAIARREDADLYHLHDSELLPLARQLHRDGRRVVFDMHENLPKDVLVKHWIPRPFRRMAARCAAAGLRRCLDGVPVVFAERSYADDFRWAKPSCVVLNMPIVAPLLAAARQSAEHAPDRRLSSTRAIAYLGVVDEDHGSCVMLDAMGRLAHQGIATALECVGPITDAHHRELRDLAVRLGLADVRWHGYLPPNEAWRTTASGHVGLALLARRPNLAESYPTKLFEYMALGMPVIASDHPLYREVVDRFRCGLCVAPDDVEGLAQKLGWLLCHEHEARAMGRRGREAVLQHFRWENEARKLVDFYGDLLARPLHGTRIAGRAA